MINMIKDYKYLIIQIINEFYDKFVGDVVLKSVGQYQVHELLLDMK